MDRLPVTAAGHAALEDELQHRTRVERPRLIQRIQQAIADDSNLAENSEYQAARADQDFNDARIAELEDKLAGIEVIDVAKFSGDTIRFGATATLIDADGGEKKASVSRKPTLTRARFSRLHRSRARCSASAKGAASRLRLQVGLKCTKSARLNGLRR